MKTKKARRLVPAAIGLMAAASLAACGANGPRAEDGGGGGDAEPLRVAMVSHGDGGAFWSIVKRGAEAGAKNTGTTLDYSESNNDPQRQAQLIDAALTQKPDALVVSAPNPDAIQAQTKKAAQAGVAVFVINSGVEKYEQLGAVSGVGQDPVIAGEATGERLKGEGVRKALCVIHEQSNIELQGRCEGVGQGLGEANVDTINVAGNKDVATSTNEIKSKVAGGDYDAVVTLDPEMALATKAATDGQSDKPRIATFDLNGDVVSGVLDGTFDFAVDQQPYLQGYLPITLARLYKENGNVLGGGRTILSGPDFITKENAEQVSKLAQDGTR